ncbi:TonB-dependent receptor domain-containing protein [Marichromatium bheemlicum]|uniref:TonB-dependent receptor n=1 Tax=Marichromatium bheemlicum TaxID=365339 RepID=A0ABX1IE02_9GAMM|nr:TonB-dependent receptor [Marichromatium bheemlicum]NKN34395.1 TonB-dependent receptor [Marichromatium bheemlicum]
MAVLFAPALPGAPLSLARARSSLLVLGAVLAGLLVAADGRAEAVLELPSLVVTATLSEQEARDAPGSVTVISRDELDARPVRDVFDAVRDVPGVTISGVERAGRRVINIRGLDSKHVLLLNDGRRVAATDEYFGHSDYGYAWTPLSDVERIEVIRGPLSALYGSDAMGGVINVITQPVGETWRGAVRVLGGVAEHGRGGEEYQLGTSLSGPLLDERLGLRISALMSRVDDTALADDPRVSELEGRDVRALTGALTWVPAPGHRIEFGALGGEEERWRDTDYRGGPPLHTNRYDLFRAQYFLSYRGELGPARLALDGYRTRFDARNRPDDPGVAPTARQSLVEDVVKGYVTLPLLEGHVVTLGGEYREETLRHPALTRGEDSADNRALFVQDEWSLLDDLTLTLGMRYDDQRFFGAETSPRAYLVYHLNPQWTLRGGVGQGFRAPTLKQLSPEYSFAGAHGFRGNPELRPEHSDNYELGAAYQGEGVEASLMLFRNDIDDLLANQCIEHCDRRIGRVFEHININQARTQGIESSLALTLPHGIGLAVDYTYLEARDETNQRRLGGRPRATGAVRLTWDQAPWGLRPQLRVEYVGSQVLYGTGSSRYDLPDYTQLHLNVRKDLGPDLEVALGVENLTDENPLEKSADFTYSERGRFVYLSLQAQFD